MISTRPGPALIGSDVEVPGRAVRVGVNPRETFFPVTETSPARGVGQGERSMAEALKIRVEPRDPAKNKGTGTPGVAAAPQGGPHPGGHLRAQAGGRADHAHPRRRLADDQGGQPPGRAGPGRHDRDGPDPRRPVGPPGQGDPPPRLRPRQRRGADRDRGQRRAPRRQRPASPRGASSSSSSTRCGSSAPPARSPTRSRWTSATWRSTTASTSATSALPPGVTVERRSGHC